MSIDQLALKGREPLRADLLAIERLCEHAREIGESRRSVTGPVPHPAPLGSLVAANGRALEEFNRSMADAVRSKRPISTSIEWILDNFYLIEDQVTEIRRDLPAGYVLELPRIAEAPWEGFPRTYEAAVELISHTDARLDGEYLTRFVMAYQEGAPLTMGEVWAVPTMLRIALVDNIARLAARIEATYRRERDADAWADRLLIALQDEPHLAQSLAEELTETHAEVPASFVIRLSQRLQGLDIDVGPVTRWLERRIAELGDSIESVVHAELQSRAADQVSIANSVTSIRFLTSYDWRSFFADASLVEQTLGRDPAGVYARMDFTSRDRYRHALEGLAKHAPHTELEVAEIVVRRARDALESDASDPARGHVGFYLISEGRYELERELGYEPLRRELTHRGPLSRRGALYWGSLGGLSVAFAVGLGAFMYAWGTGWAMAALVMLVALIPISDLAIHLVNRTAVEVWPPRVLPKLDLEDGVTANYRTLVVIPALVTSPPDAQTLIDNLEIHYLSNTDPDIHFGLLTDLKSAPKETMPEDASIVEAAVKGIELLNERYMSEGTGPFHLLVRRRRFNEAEGVWMGRERKRGALEELNHHLLGDADASFAHQIGDDAFLGGVTFVLTVDADTVVPRDVARRLIGTIAHPLNRAQVDLDRRSIVRGYGLVQPRVNMSLRAARRSLLAWLYSGPVGVDPYAGAASDTYQDVFGEGSYTGKGVYDVSVFSSLLENRIPDDQLLSHDLLESCFVRTALASDIEVLDDYPASYATHTGRLHRWVRGDWQTLPWLMPTIPNADGTRSPNPLSFLSRWKLFDNLRRSLFAPNLLLLLSLGWLILPGRSWAWSLTLLAILLFPVYAHLADSLLTHPSGVTLGSSLHSLWLDLARDTMRAFLVLTMLPHQAWMMTDAIVRALYRSHLSRRHMLEWETAAEAEYRAGTRLRDFWRFMWPASLLGVVALLPTLVYMPHHRVFAIPLAIVWALAPFFAYLVSMAPPKREVPATRKELLAMRRVARKTWRFFETFVTEEHHWLAPDNFQEDPSGAVAHRTSPTNVGLQLLADLTAYDLGYSGPGELAERVDATLETLSGLERFHGHFYNWYDTRSLEVLPPGYVSTVDSGNLIGYLVTLANGLVEATEAPVFGSQIIDGLADTVRLALEDLRDLAGDPACAEAVQASREPLEELLRRLSMEEPPKNLGGWSRLLDAAGAIVQRLPAELDAVADVVREVAGHTDELKRLAPWAELLVAAPPHLREEALAVGLKPLLDHVPSLVGLAEGLEIACDALVALGGEPSAGTEEERDMTAAWCGQVNDGIAQARKECRVLLMSLRASAGMARWMVEDADFTLLYDEKRKVFSIGYNTAQGRTDDSYYDMLASECRLASYVAISLGQVPEEHWFRLGRQLTSADGGHALVSWSASMFEYLMPLLVMRRWDDTLLDQTYRTVVKRQIQYGRQRGVPWGVSESAFNAKDVELTYQYQAFGVPGLGLKRGLSEDVVVAPYATVLALAIDREAALANLAYLSREGAEGRYGYYEAVDYTPGRVPAGKHRAIVLTYMAHHQGMTLVALGNELTSDAMRGRFEADPRMCSATLLLTERVPRHVPIAHPHAEELRYVAPVTELPPPANRLYESADTPMPATHFLSNGRYTVMVTNAGGGFSRYLDHAVSRYREDVTRDCWGMFFYVRDTKTGRAWGATHQPLITEPDSYHVMFAADKAEFLRHDGDIETHTEIVVSPEDDVEIRRVTLTNRGVLTAELDVTSYFEVSLTPQAADQAHKTFQNLFVETEACERLDCLMFSRRPRSSDELRLWGFHVLATDAVERGPVSFETNRAEFVGRLGSISAAKAILEEPGPLSGTVGAVLDPVVGIRQPLRIRPKETIRLAYATGVATSRDEAETLAEKYRDVRSGERAAELAWTASQMELRDLGISPEDALTFERLASRLVLTDAYSRLKVKTPVENGLPISALWSLGMSGDLPILLVKIDRPEEAPLVRQVLLAHQYWRHKGLIVDLVVLNTRPTGYADELEDRLKFLVRTGHALQLIDKPGGVYLRRVDHMHPDVLNLLETVARATLFGESGPLDVQLNLRGRRPETPPSLEPQRSPTDYEDAAFERPRPAFDNEYGGFDPEEHEYVIVLEGGTTTPAPWVNVMANESFGGMVSEAGIGCTWALNSHENRLTTWNNDPVTDGSGEMFYVRDEETGEFWSPTLAPAREPGPYVVRHGRGYTRFWHSSHGIEQEILWFVPVGDPVRVARVKLTNTTGAARRISVTHFVEWVLGSSRSLAQHRVVTWYDAEERILTAHNHQNIDFPGRAAFLAADVDLDSYTGSRTEFIGRNRSPATPLAMGRVGLGGETGRFLDNCGALMTKHDIAPGETVEVTFLLGQTDTLDEAREVVRRYRRPWAVDKKFADARAHWDELLGRLTVKTPEKALDLMVNGPLLYQALACRIWGRTGLYQSSGAFGFRDQLQDTLAFGLARPELMREQIIECARHQFEEGDVLHWWMPPSGRGVRTRISDDRHWLAYAVGEYLEATGDTSILDVEVPYITGPALEEGQEDSYMQPQVTETLGTIYDHCVAALESGRPTGPHGLPLMGGGDWNDGMNRVGYEGRGESVWLAWFLTVVLTRFASIADARGDLDRAKSYRKWCSELVAAIEEHGWDGAWYRRAYFDDGTPLGTRQAEECRIDAIAQAWATISGAGDKGRARRALESVEEHLVRWEDRLIMLLTPPFDKMAEDPGYIKGYVPGVRENGGQYTHGVVWVAMAYLLIGDGDEGLSLLDLLNPVKHASTRLEAEQYEVEPYSIAADVYAMPPHIGRGGWTWYTGSAAWFYKVAVQYLLGIKAVAVDGVRHLAVDPCIPKGWPGFEATYRVEDTTYEITVENPRGVNRGVERVELDGRPLQDARIPIVGDGKTHQVVVTLLGG